MSNKLKLAIIGHGFVGKAVDYGFNNPNIKKYIIDPKYNTDIKSLTTEAIDIAFVCVPTPMADDGSIDTTILESVVKYLQCKYIVIKSTVTPDIIHKLFTTYFNIIYNPEFLTEKSANEDFVNPIMHIFGGDYKNTLHLENIYKEFSSCKPCPVFHMSVIDASFVKYGVNTFLASKVLWFNQFYDIIEKFGGNYGKIIGAITTDSRIGKSHTTVPGYDGKRGFSGACFPKDTVAFYKFTNNNFTVLKEVILRNQDYRLNYSLDDREKMQNIKFNINL